MNGTYRRNILRYAKRHLSALSLYMLNCTTIRCRCYDATELIVRLYKTTFGVSLCKASCVLSYSLAGPNEHSFSLCQAEAWVLDFKNFWQSRRGPKSAVTVRGSNVFRHAALLQSPLSNNIEIFLSSIQEKTDPESCISSLAYHTKTTNDTCHQRFAQRT